MNSPMAAMMAMRMQQPQPAGINQQMPTSDPSAAPGASQPQQPDPGQEMPPGGLQGPLQGMSDAATGSGNQQMLLQMLPLLQKLYPQLKVADMKHGRAELHGPTQEQFLGSAWAKHHGAKEHHVKNKGRGQRLHVSW